MIFRTPDYTWRPQTTKDEGGVTRFCVVVTHLPTGLYAFIWWPFAPEYPMATAKPEKDKANHWEWRYSIPDGQDLRGARMDTLPQLIEETRKCCSFLQEFNHMVYDWLGSQGYEQRHVNKAQEALAKQRAAEMAEAKNKKKRI